MEASALQAPAGLARGSGTSPWLRLRSDEQLVGLFRSGSEEAFRVIHDRYRQRLYAYARQMLGGSGPDAEDVLQDVFLRAYRALRVDERPVSLRAWLYRVAHNRCIDGLRRPVPAPAEIFEMSRTPVLDTTAQAERREDLQRLIADVRRLPEQQRSALLMREMDGMSYADLATALDTSVPAIKSLLVRARIGLVEAIEARDADCADIRHDLAASYDRGVRANGRARRHLRDCDGCTSYRAQMRGVRQGFAALSPGVAAPGLVAKLLGIGGAGSGAAGAASGTVGAIGGGVTAAGVSVAKVAAIVCGAAAITGGAVEVQRVVAPDDGPAPALFQRAVAGAAAAAPVTTLRGPAVPGLERPGSVAADTALHPYMAAPGFGGERNSADLSAASGGVLAPEEPSTEAPMDTPAPAPAEHDPAPVTEEGAILGLPESATPTPTSSHSTSSAESEQSSPSSSGAHESSSAPGGDSGASSSSSTSGSSTGSPSGTSSSPSTTGGSPTAPVGPAATSPQPAG